MTEKEKLNQKRFDLAEREFHSMDEAEIIDLLITSVYNKMSDKIVKIVWNDLFSEKGN